MASFIFDAAPQVLHKDIVESSIAAVHSDPNAGRLQDVGKGLGAELASLVGVGDLGAAAGGPRR